MARKEIFLNKKYILSSGREVDLSAELIDKKIVVSAMFNMHDPVQEVGHAAMIRMENNQTVSFESLGTNAKDESLRELSKPIDGLNGAELNLKIFELNELLSVMQQFLQKIDKEILAVKK